MCSMYEHRVGPRRGWWFLLGLPFILAFLAVGSLVVMLLWNALLPAIFGLKSISFLQAAGLLVLSKILFGGFRHRPRPFYGPKRHWAQWKNWREGESETSGDEGGKE